MELDNSTQRTLLQTSAYLAENFSAQAYWCKKRNSTSLVNASRLADKFCGLINNSAKIGGKHFFDSSLILTYYYCMNTLKTTLFFALLTGILLAVGYYVGGQNGAITAFIVSALMNLGTYWFSDKLVLAMYRAKESSPQTHPELHRIVEDLAQRANLPKPKVYLIDMASPNAFATGRNQNHAVIAVTNGILVLLAEKELRGVIAHEMAHIKNKDMLLSTIAATIAGAISYLAQMMYFTGSFAGNSRDNDSRGNALGALALLILTPIIATLLHLALSRSREYLADETGSVISNDPLSLASALKKLHQYSRERPLALEPKYEATAHLFIVNPLKPSLLASLFSTHPPIEERIKRLTQNSDIVATI